MEHQELADWLRLLLTPGIGNGSARKLLAAFGLPAAMLSQSPAVLAQVVGAAQAAALQQAPEDLAALLESTWNWLQADTASRRILTLGDPLYPQSLLQTEDPPLLLYAMGMAGAWSHNLLNATACLAVVGSRNPSPQGAENSRQFARALADAGLCIVSGMATGVDGAAHEGALQAAAEGTLATVAVVGTGLDRVYPGRHRDLAHRIAQQGLLLSEFALGTPPLAPHFPQRNRIIAGLSRGTLVVEAALQSGSLITARLAAEQGREVFAIPGSIHSTQSHGCHALIKQGAKLVESAQDVLEELALDHAAEPDSDFVQTLPPEDASSDSALLRALGHDPVGLDALQARTGLPTQHLLAELMTLELQGQVVRRPGGQYQRMTLA
ncbi:MAG: DNA-protecting protein DprA [Rhodoferax sp.]|nr:DNA-protecting protein DprA [Rhodoferax sp.]